jgi:Protein of unknown function (DUF2914)
LVHLNRVNSFMSEKKNIVIKVKYPTPGNIAAKPVSAPGMITEWNLKRVGLALGSVLLILTALFYITGSDDQNSDTNTQLALPEQAAEIKAQPEKVDDIPEKPKLGLNKAVARSQLTSEIEKNEPVDSLKLPLKIGIKETIWIYYFVELKGMEGKTVHHEWWLNGNLVSRKKVNISADSWRTASKQLITYTKNHDWVVRLVDEARNKLDEKSFNLELK